MGARGLLGGWGQQQWAVGQQGRCLRLSLRCSTHTQEPMSFSRRVTCRATPPPPATRMLALSGSSACAVVLKPLLRCSLVSAALQGMRMVGNHVTQQWVCSHLRDGCCSRRCCKACRGSRSAHGVHALPGLVVKHAPSRGPAEHGPVVWAML
jgi:hypothetical protein